MSLSVSQDEGVTVFTITSNPKSKCPTVCQILGNLCFSSPCLFPKNIREMMYIPTALGIVEIIVGLLNIIAGILFLYWGVHDYIMMWNTPFWLGGVFLISGIMTILVYCIGGCCVYALALVLNEASGVVAMIGVALYSWDLVSTSSYAPEQRINTHSFLYDKDWIAITRGTLDMTMIVLTILQFCANITFVVSFMRACVMKDDDPQLHKLLPEKITGNPEC